MGVPDPYDGWFWVEEMSVAGQKKGEVFKEEALTIKVAARVRSLVAGEARVETWDKKTIFKVDRKY
jgi:hypothetical protein